MNKFLNSLALLTSLGIAGIAAYFSVLGLATIFAGAYLGVVIMASALEFGKIVTAAYLHLVWNKLGVIKYYLAFSVFVLMLITSLGIFGYLAKASSDTSYATAAAQQEIVQIDNQIGREENRIILIEQRIKGLTSGGLDVTDSVNAQIEIRDGAWDRVQGDIDFAEGQIRSLRSELTALDTAVTELREKGVEVITLDEGGAFRQAETEKIDYIAQADALYESQSEQREDIRKDIKSQQDNIDNYRKQAQTTINNANAEISRLRNLSTGDADEKLEQVEEYNRQIDTVYDTIQELREEKFPFEQELLGFQREVGPIQYIAEVIYGQDESVKYLDNAIRAVIFALIFVFDPLAILLLITSVGLIARRIEEEKPKVIEQRYILQVPKKKMEEIRKNTL
tara:strand:- start:17491 stop:18675 length:1185 start_codon:yes stop_codon:yes gene_type:complete